MDNLETIVEGVVARLEETNRVREETLVASRRIIQHAAKAIRAAHRAEFEQAETILEEVRQLVRELGTRTSAHPLIYAAGYVHDAEKEFAEACLTLAMIRGDPLPGPAALEVRDSAYLNGLGEAVGEMRRHALDLIRRGHLDRAEAILAVMEDVYGLLVTVDFPHAITGNIRRTTDMVRGVVERTRGDITSTIKQQELRHALARFEERITSLTDLDSE